MPAFNPFNEEWRACLQAHYEHVLRIQDVVTEPTLYRVLRNTGFSEEQIAKIQFDVIGLVEAALEPPQIVADAPPESIALEEPVAIEYTASAESIAQFEEMFNAPPSQSDVQMAMNFDALPAEEPVAAPKRKAKKPDVEQPALF